MRYVILLFSLLLIACDSGTQNSTDNQTVTETPPPFEANYRIIDADSHLTFMAEQEGSSFSGEFESFNATIYFDETALDQSRVHVSVPLSSFDAGNADRNSTAPNSAWFDMKNFPEAVFEADTIRQTDNGYVADGTLTMKGLSQPLSLPFTLEEQADQVIMRSETRLDRTNWNVGTDPWDTDEYVSREIVLNIQLTAEKLP